MLAVSVLAEGQIKPGAGWLEYPANKDPEAYPYLITSSRSLFWIWQPPKGPMVRTGVRYGQLNDILKDAIIAIKDMGIKLDWGNVHKATEEGLEKAIAHVKSYGIEEIEIVTNESWLPEGITVVIPKDRSVLGYASITSYGPAILVTNPSRAIGIVV